MDYYIFRFYNGYIKFFGIKIESLQSKRFVYWYRNPVILSFARKCSALKNFLPFCYLPHFKVTAYTTNSILRFNYFLDIKQKHLIINMKWNLSESRWTMGLNQIMKKKGDYPYARIIGEA